MTQPPTLEVEPTQRRRAVARLWPLCVLAALAIASLATRAGAKPNAEFARLKVGQVGYLAALLESDNDPRTRPVCRTMAQEIAFWRSQVNDCPHRRWGTEVVVTDIRPGLSDDRTIMLHKSIPFFAIRSRDGRWTGWVQGGDVMPIIPPGTRIRMTTVGNAVPSVYRNKSDAVGHDVQIGSPVTVEVIRQEPPSGDCPLLVRVLTGPKTGTTGWTCNDGTIEGTNYTSAFLN